jgi:hypothetical protein
MPLAVMVSMNLTGLAEITGVIVFVDVMVV